MLTGSNLNRTTEYSIKVRSHPSFPFLRAVELLATGIQPQSFPSVSLLGFSTYRSLFLHSYVCATDNFPHCCVVGCCCFFAVTLF